MDAAKGDKYVPTVYANRYGDESTLVTGREV